MGACEVKDQRANDEQDNNDGEDDHTEETPTNLLGEQLLLDRAE
jgi:hypothetical protein